MKEPQLKSSKDQLREEFGSMYKKMVDPAERAKVRIIERRKDKVEKKEKSYGI